MSTLVLALLVAAVTAVLFALAWWSSGRVRGRAPSAAVRATGETEALKRYNPAGGTPGAGV
jgi:hypothetical protein